MRLLFNFFFCASAQIALYMQRLVYCTKLRYTLFFTDSIKLQLSRAKNWRSHGRQWRVKTDQGHQELTVKRPMCDYATEFRKVAL